MGSSSLFLCTLRFVITLGFWVPKLWNMALSKGIWDPKLRGTNIKGTNLKSLILLPCNQMSYSLNSLKGVV